MFLFADCATMILRNITLTEAGVNFLTLTKKIGHLLVVGYDINTHHIMDVLYLLPQDSIIPLEHAN